MLRRSNIFIATDHENRGSSIGAKSNFGLSRKSIRETMICRSYGAHRELGAGTYKDLAPTEHGPVERFFFTVSHLITFRAEA